MFAGKSSRLIAILLIISHIGILSPALLFGVETINIPEEKARIIVPLPSASELISVQEGGVVRLGTTEIEIPAGALSRDTEIRITRLYRVEDTGDMMKNVTFGGGGYRFEPAGTQFLIPVTIRMSYEPDLSESAKETLYTYYYDKKTNRWEQLEKGGFADGRVESYTTHFTDMINGTLSLPEGPSPLRFNLNSIKGLEAANPSSGVVGIQGLEANNTGSASFQIPIELPPGRAGMVPRVSITYSSDGGNGLLGRGFDLQAGGRISTDTRWGVPRFNGTSVSLGEGIERDEYVLDGVKLKEESRGFGRITYKSERETRYEKIERVIDRDYWVVTDRMGTRRTYGKTYWSGADAGKKHIWEHDKVRIHTGQIRT